MRSFLRLSCLLTAVSLSGGCVLCKVFCPAPPPLLSDLNWATPEAAVDTYRKAFKAENGDYEFLCLSRKLLDKYGIGITEYTLGRDRFLEENRALKDHFLEAEVKGVRAVPGAKPPQVVVRLQRGEHHVDFLLVNEPILWVHAVEDGDALTLGMELESLASVIRVEGNWIRIVDLPAAEAALPLPEDIHEVRLTDRWRLLDIVGRSASLDTYFKQSKHVQKAPVQAKEQ